MMSYCHGARVIGLSFTKLWYKKAIFFSKAIGNFEFL